MSEEEFEEIFETLYLLQDKSLVQEAKQLKDAPESEFATKEDLTW